VIIDNEDAENYSETGTWATSVAQAYGPSSRYAYIQSTPNGPTATFKFQLSKSGNYDIFEILPYTENSADNALYKILIGDRVTDSLYLNQNVESGNWKNIGRFYLPADSLISVKVIDSGESSSGPVIRADAFKVLLFEESPINVQENNSIQVNEYQLDQNYPNPFNPSTRISWQSPVGSHQTFKVYDVLGNEVAALVDEYKPSGRYEIEFNGSNLASGIYLYKLQAGSFVETKKMILLK
jgi:hypothetical protein